MEAGAAGGGEAEGLAGEIERLFHGIIRWGHEQLLGAQIVGHFGEVANCSGMGPTRVNQFLVACQSSSDILIILLGQ